MDLRMGIGERSSPCEATTVVERQRLRHGLWPARAGDRGGSLSGATRARHCAKFVTDSSAFALIPAHSSALIRRELLLPLQAFARTSTTSIPDLKILVSAVQSRPSPPFFSPSCRTPPLDLAGRC